MIEAALLLTGAGMLLAFGAACSSREVEAQKTNGTNNAATSSAEAARRERQPGARGRAGRLAGRVLGGGAPIAGSTVSLWEASADAPEKLAETKTDERGQFEVRGAWRSTATITSGHPKRRRRAVAAPV
jgi:hypothetical protein